jgi:hypothetical protein
MDNFLGPLLSYLAKNSAIWHQWQKSEGPNFPWWLRIAKNANPILIRNRRSEQNTTGDPLLTLTF